MKFNCANWDELPWTEVRPGVRRKAFTGEGATFAMNELQPHHEPKPHQHPYEQIAYIASGVCDYHIEGSGILPDVWRYAGNSAESGPLCRGGGR